MAEVASVKIHGLAQLQRAFKDYSGGVSKMIDVELLAGGEIIVQGARARFAMIDTTSAAGFKARTKGFGRVVVEQSKRKRTGLRPDYGSLQMRRALIPARSEGFDKVVEHMDRALGRLAGEEGF